MTEPGQRKPHSSRWTLAILFLVFIAPAAGGWLWFTFGSDLKQRNFGTLYQPARPLADLGFGGESGEESGFADLRDTWTLMYVGAGACNDQCLEQLDKINRIRLGQSKNSKRVRMLYLAGAPVDAALEERIKALMPGGVVVLPGDEALQHLIPRLLHPGEDSGRVRNRVYVVDPIGNLVLSYEADADPGGMNKDLARLLRASQIG